MKRMLSVALALALALSSSSVFAQTPDRAKEAKQLHDEARQWQWSGAALAIGGIVYEVLGQTSLAQENTFCTSVRNFASCTTTKDPNMGAVYGGAGMAGTGAVMMVFGAMKESRAKKLTPELMFGAHGFKIQKRLVF